MRTCTGHRESVDGLFEAGKVVGSGRGGALDSPSVFRVGDHIGREWVGGGHDDAVMLVCVGESMHVCRVFWPGRGVVGSEGSRLGSSRV